MRARRTRQAALLCLCLPLLAAGPSRADDVGPAWPEDALPADALLTGEEIYRRVLRNRLKSYEKDAKITSGDGTELDPEIVTSTLDMSSDRCTRSVAETSSGASRIMKLGCDRRTAQRLPISGAELTGA